MHFADLVVITHLFGEVGGLRCDLVEVTAHVLLQEQQVDRRHRELALLAAPLPAGLELDVGAVRREVQKRERPILAGRGYDVDHLLLCPGMFGHV